MALRPAREPGWYRLDPGHIAALYEVPGLRVVGDHVLAHESLLPLLPQDADAARLLTPGAPPAPWYTDKLAEAGIVLRPTQETAIAFLRQRRGALLADDMRLGKTLSAILAHEPGSGQLVIVCPLMVRAVFLGWLRRLFDPGRIFVMTGRRFDRAAADADVVIGHYEILPYWQSGRPIGTVIFDEAHALTNRQARRTLAAGLLASRAKRVICLTGTPIWNMPPDLWAILTLIAPAAWGSYHEFSRRYGRPEETGYGTVYTGISNEAELRARLDVIMLRRRWVDVVESAPAIHRSVLIADITQTQRNKLDLIAAQLFEAKGKTTAGLFASYRRALSQVKRVRAVAEARRLAEGGQPCVLWTWHVDLAKRIAADLGAALVTGETPTKDRDEILAGWKAQPSQALVVTMAVAQVGLDFSHARTAIFAELDYTPAMLAQAEMRTFAPTRSMDVIFIVADHVVDRRVVLALSKKLGAASPVGVAAAGEAIGVLHEALYGPDDPPDMDRLMASLLDGDD